MYNRYIRNDQGGYTRVPEPVQSGRETPPQAPSESQSGTGPPPGGERPPRDGPSPPRQEAPPHRHTSERPAYENADNPGNSGLADGLTGFLRHMLDQFHLDSVDTGDLLLLGLLFFLFREDADEELLVALATRFADYPARMADVLAALEREEDRSQLLIEADLRHSGFDAVSYTHLTLPTSDLV